jgi:hypothetical protein
LIQGKDGRQDINLTARLGIGFIKAASLCGIPSETRLMPTGWCSLQNKNGEGFSHVDIVMRSTMKMYLRFAAMIATSTVVMFGLMYLNTYALDHIFFSETRVYMALLMGACMVFIMLAYMQYMMSNKKINAGISGASIVFFAVSLWLVRSQQTVDEVSWMKAMIPHHSIAILTSERANITDPRMQKLAAQIIESQRQ